MDPALKTQIDVAYTEANVARPDQPKHTMLRTAVAIAAVLAVAIVQVANALLEVAKAIREYHTTKETPPPKPQSIPPPFTDMTGQGKGTLDIR